MSLADQVGVMRACGRLAEIFDSANEEKVWSLNFLMPVGCFLLPAPRILMEVSAGFGPLWHRMVFANDLSARAALSDAGVRLFFVDVTPFNAERSPSSSVFGCMAYSPLFAPEAVTRQFRVVAHEGDAFLLTFADLAPRAPPLPPDFSARWAEHRDKLQPTGQMKEMCARVAEYYHKQGEHWPVIADPGLPKLQGWQ